MQDEMNGYGNRTANETRSGTFRCTVCGALYGPGAVDTQTKVKVEPIQQKKAVEKKVVEKAKSMKGGKR
jgi:hypothetical protein